jgi:hypothetical protein
MMRKYYIITFMMLVLFAAINVYGETQIKRTAVNEALKASLDDEGKWVQIEWSDGSGSTTTNPDATGKFIDGADPNDAVYLLGNVGVGTTTPTTTLHLNEASGETTITLSQADVPNGSLAAAGGAGTDVILKAERILGLYADEENDDVTTYMLFKTNGSERMRIDANGLVGVGAAASVEFDVQVNQNLDTSVRVTNTDAGTAAKAQMQFESDGGFTQMFRTSNAFATAAVQDDFIIQELGGGDIAIFGAAEVARFENGGDVGIGTNIPAYRLDVEDSTGTNLIRATDTGVVSFTVTSGASPSRIMLDANSTNDLSIQSTGGNVGIGLINPDTELHLEGGTNTGVKIDGSSGGCIMMRDTDDAGWSELTTLNGVPTWTIDADGICDGS